MSSTSAAASTPPPVAAPPPTTMTASMKTRSSTTAATTALGMASPTGSATASETSDYQRSTPSPRDDPNALLGSLEEWNGSRGDSDQGFSEDVLTLKQDPLMPPKVTSRKTDFSEKGVDKKAESSSAEDPRLTLQQVRVALQKIPVAQLRSRRRRHSATAEDEAIADKKKIKMEEIGADPNKITAYMPETKACCLKKLRMDKLDRILNLKSEPRSVAVDPEKHANDLFLISRLKELNNGSAESDTVKTETEAKLPPPPQSDLKKERGANRDERLFEAPRSLKQQQQHQQQQQTTIRFPKPSPESGVECRWEGCKETTLESNGKLLDHLKNTHAASQNPGKKQEDFQYKCLWKGCKVFGRASSSKSWLEKHVAGHVDGGQKPFQCIVDGCKLRFGTQSLLERHVNHHFAEERNGGANGNDHDKDDNGNSGGVASPSSSASSMMPAPSAAAVKVIRKAGKRLKYRRTIYSARIFDLFDLGVMARVRERLAKMHSLLGAGGGGGRGGRGDEVAFTSEVVARRVMMMATQEAAGGCKAPETMVLLRWKPYDILEDEWVPLKEAQTTKTVKLSSLPLTDKMELRRINQHCQQQYCLQKPQQLQQQQQQQQQLQLRNRRKARIPEQRSDALS